MVQLAGKYELVESKNLYEFMVAIGIPEDKAKLAAAMKEKAEIKVDGNKIAILSDSPRDTINVVVGGEIEEIAPGGKVLKNVATLNDGNLTVTSKTSEGDLAVTRNYTFTDAGYEVTVHVPNEGKTISATRIYKRL